jgi:hypothetical protein
MLRGRGEQEISCTIPNKEFQCLMVVVSLRVKLICNQELKVCEDGILM